MIYLTHPDPVGRIFCYASISFCAWRATATRLQWWLIESFSGNPWPEVPPKLCDKDYTSFTCSAPKWSLSHLWCIENEYDRWVIIWRKYIRLMRKIKRIIMSIDFTCREQLAMFCIHITLQWFSWHYYLSFSPALCTW